jgi:Asp-tRNA(Asn)/Glu-tRNA(Gln) amidotransferase A subunit family amidase
MTSNQMTDPTFLPAVVMAQQILSKSISPVELADAHLAKIDRLNPKLNTYVHVDRERVRREARARHPNGAFGAVGHHVQHARLGQG